MRSIDPDNTITASARNGKRSDTFNQAPLRANTTTAISNQAMIFNPNQDGARLEIVLNFMARILRNVAGMANGFEQAFA